MAESIKTPIYMTDLEADQFIKLQKYFNIVQELDRVDFFGMKNGSIELHKDKLGNLSAVIVHVHRNLRY